MAETMCTKAADGFQCFRPDGHEGPCALAPFADTGEQVAETTEQGSYQILPKGQPVNYGWVKPREFDVRLPSGSLVRLRMLNRARLIELNIMEMLDSFTPEILQTMSSGTATNEQTNEALNAALIDKDRRDALLGPVNRVVLAAVVQPKVVENGPTDETQINVHDVELEDRLAIFGVAFADQVEELKSVVAEQTVSVGDSPTGESE